MNKNFIFFIIACSLLILSIITVNVAPIISKADSIGYFEDWGIKNCKKIDDDYKWEKDNNIYDPDGMKLEEDVQKRIIKECKNHKAMYSLEYAAVVVDVSLGFICFVLSLIHYLEPGKPLEKNSGLIGVISGIIIAALTIIYVAFSAIIFNNEPIRIFHHNLPLKKIYPNKASLHYNGEKYVYDYDEEKAVKEDLDIPLIKYKDLGKKQYNYDTEIFRVNLDRDSEYSNCRVDLSAFQFDRKLTYTLNNDNNIIYDCIYIWDVNRPIIESNDNKFLYDRWLTSIILSVLIAVCGIGLAIFGFLLFNGSNGVESSPSSLPAQ